MRSEFRAQPRDLDKSLVFRVLKSVSQGHQYPLTYCRTTKHPTPLNLKLQALSQGSVGRGWDHTASSEGLPGGEPSPRLLTVPGNPRPSPHLPTGMVAGLLREDRATIKTEVTVRRRGHTKARRPRRQMVLLGEANRGASHRHPLNRVWEGETGRWTERARTGTGKRTPMNLLASALLPARVELMKRLGLVEW